jgi:hypothetical protein
MSKKKDPATPTAAAMFHVEGKYYVKATGSKDRPRVHGFEDLVEGVRYFEGGYNRAHGTSLGHSTGAVIYWLTLRPRVFSFKSVEDLEDLLGSTVYPLSLTGLGTYEMVFEAKNEDLAKSTYEAAKEPHLIG